MLALEKLVDKWGDRLFDFNFFAEKVGHAELLLLGCDGVGTGEVLLFRATGLVKLLHGVV